MPTINLWVPKSELRRFLGNETQCITGIIDSDNVPKKKTKRLHNFDWRDVYQHRRTKDGCITLKRRVK